MGERVRRGSRSRHGSRTWPVLGCVADDYTGAADVAASLRAAGMVTILLFGTPAPTFELPPCDAVVIALKTRSASPSAAVQISLGAQRWLAQQRVTHLYFKYCSTFDSTELGNIGTVADALLQATGSPLAIVCPSSPQQGRTVYQGYLFVGDRLLEESAMRDHPLNPMTDSNVLRLLRQQSTKDVGLVDLAAVRQGVVAVNRALGAMAAEGTRYAVVDAVDEADLHVVGEAAASMYLTTGAAGLARALGSAVVSDERRTDQAKARWLPDGPALILAGSCSEVTLEQVAYAKRHYAWHRVDPVRQPDEDALLAEALGWMDEKMDGGEPMLVFSSATAAERSRSGGAKGNQVGQTLERTLGAVADHGVKLGCRRLIAAGGETSGAIVDRLGIESALVTHEEDPGVPWLLTAGDPQLALLLKSGNYGRPDLLVRAAESRVS